MIFYLLNEHQEILCKQHHLLTNQTSYDFLDMKRVKGINTYRNHEAKPLIFWSEWHLRAFMRHHRVNGYSSHEKYSICTV